MSVEWVIVGRVPPRGGGKGHLHFGTGLLHAIHRNLEFSLRLCIQTSNAPREGTRPTGRAECHSRVLQSYEEIAARLIAQFNQFSGLLDD